MMEIIHAARFRQIIFMPKICSNLCFCKNDTCIIIFESFFKNLSDRFGALTCFHKLTINKPCQFFITKSCRTRQAIKLILCDKAAI